MYFRSALAVSALLTCASTSFAQPTASFPPLSPAPMREPPPREAPTRPLPETPPTLPPSVPVAQPSPSPSPREAPEAPQASPPPAAAARFAPRNHTEEPRPTYSTWRREEFAPLPSGPRAPELDAPPPPKESARDKWLLSVEGATHLPVDVGLLAGIEFPFGGRIFGGYGWIPASFVSPMMGFVGLASGNPETGDLIRGAGYAGTSFRVQVGLRPFSNAGLYFDGGFSRLSLEGISDLSQDSATGLPSFGTYQMATTLDMWLVEIGYQGKIGNVIVFGAGLGVMSTLSSTSKLASSDAPLPADIAQEITHAVDRAFERYGTVPTLTFRLGVDLI